MPGVLPVIASGLVLLAAAVVASDPACGPGRASRCHAGAPIGLIMRASAAVVLIAVCALGADTRELQGRRQRAAAAFGDGILIIHAKPVWDGWPDGFRQDAAFYYFSGLENTVGAILAIDGRSRESWLFLPTRPPTGSLEGSPDSAAVNHAGFEHMVDWAELARLLEKNKAAPVTIYYEADSYALPGLPSNIAGDPPDAPLWALAIARKWPAFRLKEVRAEVSALMNVQSPTELLDMRAAAKATVQAVMAGMRAIRPGVSQRSVEAAVEGACWKEGAHGVSFWPWAMAGRNGVFPTPFTSGARYDNLNAVMAAGDLVRLDVGCEWNHYGGDLGRTVPVSGRYSDDQREIWNIFVSAYHAGAKSLRERATQQQVFAAWSAELLRHRDSAKGSLAAGD